MGTWAAGNFKGRAAIATKNVGFLVPSLCWRFSERAGELEVPTEHRSHTVTHFQHIMVKDMHYCSKMEEREDSEETLDQCKTKTSWANSKLHFRVCCQSTLQSSTPLSFADCNTPLSLELLLFPVSSVPGISNTWGSPGQPRLHLHSVTQWPLCASIQGQP